MVSISAIVTCGLSNEQIASKPIDGWRLRLKNSLVYLGYCFFFCLGFHRIKQTGRLASRAEASILVVAPHTSLFDTFAYFATWLPCGVSRVENLMLPLFGWGVKAVQPILVARDNSSKKDDVIGEIRKRADHSSPWKQLYIYPGNKRRTFDASEILQQNNIH